MPLRRFNIEDYIGTKKEDRANLRSHAIEHSQDTKGAVRYHLPRQAFVITSGAIECNDIREGQNGEEDDELSNFYRNQSDDYGDAKRVVKQGN